MSCMLLNNETLCDIARFFVLFNNELPADLRISCAPGIDDEDERDYNNDVLKLASYFKMLNATAYMFRYSDEVVEDLDIDELPELKNVSIGRFVKELECLIYNCYEGEFIPEIIEGLGLSNIKNYIKKGFKEQDKNDYENSLWG